MKRREFVRLGWATIITTGAGKLRPAFGEYMPGSLQHQMAPARPKTTRPATDFTLQIAPTLVELAPQVVISTIGYNNKVPDPLLRCARGNSSPSTYERH